MLKDGFSEEKFCETAAQRQLPYGPGHYFRLICLMPEIISQAIQTDDVVDTVNYAEIHEAVKAEMSIPSKLLEHVCGRIAKRLLAEFPAIEEIELRLSKRNPPMGADIDSAGVELHCSR